MTELEGPAPLEDAAALLAQGLRLAREGRLEEAARAYESVLEADAGSFEAVHGLSALLGRLGQLDRALELAQRGIALRPDSWLAYARAGALLAAMNRPGEALGPLQRALSIDRNQPEVLNNLGAALLSTGRIEEALAHFAQALALAPAYFDARYNFAGTLVRRERYAEAIPEYEALLERAPDSADVRGALGKALWKAGRLDEAIAAFERTIALEPGRADAFAQLANALVECGRIDEATSAFEQAIRLAPERGELYRLLAEIRPDALTPQHVAALEVLAENDTGLADDARIDVHFALGRVYADAGDRARSFRHFTEANAYKRRLVDYDEAAFLESFEVIAATFGGAFLETRRGCSDASPVSIFIFGMPRSGTTLVEQILASHSSVYGAGELALFEDTATDVLASGGAITRETLLDASCDRLREIGCRYAATLRALAPATAERITDKMPTNFRYAGLIHITLPNARMIHVQRDPLDTCLSCFSQHFAEGQPFAYDLGELGRYYRGYERLMQHWRTVLPPGAMLEVNYEDVVEDVETQARRIVAYCGLEWEPACLEFYKTQRHVRTASATQVRRPLYRTSLHRAHEYGDLLGPLLEALAGPVRRDAR